MNYQYFIRQEKSGKFAILIYKDSPVPLFQPTYLDYLNNAVEYVAMKMADLEDVI